MVCVAVSKGVHIVVLVFFPMVLWGVQVFLFVAKSFSDPKIKGKGTEKESKCNGDYGFWTGLGWLRVC